MAEGFTDDEIGVPFLLDACQSVGQRRIDVSEIGCDLLSATGRKYLRGPRGTGFLYVSDALVDQLTPPHPDHHGTELVSADRFECARLRVASNTGNTMSLHGSASVQLLTMPSAGGWIASKPLSAHELNSSARCCSVGDRRSGSGSLTR